MAVIIDKWLTIDFLGVLQCVLISPSCSTAESSSKKEVLSNIYQQANREGWNFRCGCRSAPDGSWNYRLGVGSGPGGATYGFGSGSGRKQQGGGGFGYGWGGGSTSINSGGRSGVYGGDGGGSFEYGFGGGGGHSCGGYIYKNIPSYGFGGGSPYLNGQPRSRKFLLQ